MMKKLTSIISIICALAYLPTTAASPKCPPLAKIRSFANMNLEAWEITVYKYPGRKNSYKLTHANELLSFILTIQCVEGDTKEDAIKVGYEILNTISETPTLINSSFFWGTGTHCVYVAPDGRYLQLNTGFWFSGNEENQ